MHNQIVLQIMLHRPKKSTTFFENYLQILNQFNPSLYLRVQSKSSFLRAVIFFLSISKKNQIKKKCSSERAYNYMDIWNK